MKKHSGIIVVIIALIVVSGAFFSLYLHGQTKIREAREKRIKAEQVRLAFEAEQKRLEEEEQEKRRIAKEEEEKRKRAEMEEQAKRLALEQAEIQKRETEKNLGRMPVQLSSNNVVSCSFGKGEIIQIYTDGFAFKTDDRTVPRIGWTKISEEDAAVLLRTPKIFDTATSFGLNQKQTTVLTDSDGNELEQWMRKKWHDADSLKDRLAMRMTVLGRCKEYNETRARYVASLANSSTYARAAQQAEARAEQSAAGRKAGAFLALSSGAQQDYLYGTVGGSPSDLLRQIAANRIMSSAGQTDYSKADNYSKAARTQSAGAVTAVDKLNDCIDALNQLGFSFPGFVYLSPIPPMNLRREVAAELNAMDKK